jgi:hypothetical protein
MAARRSSIYEHAEYVEWSHRVTPALRVVIVRHPDLDRNSQKYSLIDVPRFGLYALSRLTHKINVGLGVEASLQRQTRGDDVRYQHT